MPVHARSLVGWGSGLALLAKEKNNVIPFFQELTALGYDRFQFKTRLDDGEEVHVYSHNITLNAAEGIVALAQEKERIIETLGNVHAKYNQLLPLYFTFRSVPMPTDGLLFQPEGVKRLTAHFDVIHAAVADLDLLNTTTTAGTGSASPSLSALYTCPELLLQFAENKEAIQRYARLVDGENKLTPERFGYSRQIPEQAQDHKLMDLFERLQPYATHTNKTRTGISLNIQLPMNWTKHTPRYVATAKKLAAEHADAIVTFSQALYEYGARFDLTNLVSDEKTAVKLFAYADDLHSFVQRVLPYGHSFHMSRYYCDLDYVRHNKRTENGVHPTLKDYVTIIQEGLAHPEPFIGLVEAIHEKHGLSFRSMGLSDVLFFATEVHAYTQKRACAADIVASELRIVPGSTEYTISDLQRVFSEMRRAA